MDEQANLHQYSPSRTFMRMLRMGRPYLAFYLLIAVAILFEAALSVAFANMYQVIVSGMVNSEYRALIQAVVFMSFITFFMSCVIMVRTYLGSKLDNNSRLQLQGAMLRKFSDIQLGSFDKYHTSDKIARVLESASVAQAGINHRLIGLIADTTKVIAILSYLCFLSVKLTIGSLVMAAIIPLLLLPFSKISRKFFDKQNRLSAEKDGIAQEAVQGGEVVRSYQLQEEMNNRFSARFSQYVRTRMKTLSIESFTGSVNSVVPFFVYYFYSWIWRFFLVYSNEMEVGAVAAFLAASNLLIGPMLNLFGTWNALQWSISQAKRVFEIMDLPDEKKEGAQIAEITNAQESTRKMDLSMEKVSFSYEDEGEEVLRNVSFTIAKDQTVAIVGPSGSGKSTLFKLLMKYYEPSSGSVRWNGIDCTALNAENWRSKLALVSQTPFLFHGTVYDNIHYGNAQASKEDVIEAAKAANIHEVIMNLPLGYDSIIGERGQTLSGGERQRVAIARAFFA